MNLESKHDLKEKIRLRYKGGDVENMHAGLNPTRQQDAARRGSHRHILRIKQQYLASG